ncbi:hypothetical protein COLO4_33967 [Corchorus olitorius]|uniref:Uncharacterized protein n=1 Tax=Corchorus olitorius TaxID=93759 RepID=A0A1R3GPP8_9ROSI|nr:hypothetical protein COLO4_33967 [Corchorus olitorius]
MNRANGRHRPPRASKETMKGILVFERRCVLLLGESLCVYEECFSEKEALNSSGKREFRERVLRERVKRETPE